MMTAGTADRVTVLEENPPRADLKTLMRQYPLPTIPPGTVNAISMTGDAAVKAAQGVIDKFNAAICADDAKALAACFLESQAWWKDSLALTYHLRTFNTPETVAAALLETKKLRDFGKFNVGRRAVFIPVTPSLFIDCGIALRTTSPAATCTGKFILLPFKDSNSTVKWKIWVLSTRLDNLDSQPEDESLLETPARQLSGVDTIETEVFILGAGNAAIALAARLKAVGVESIMAERNAKVGDNWTLRYDSLKFHVPTSFCELPFMNYGDELQSPHLLSRRELADQVCKYVEAFKLNVINSAKLRSTCFDPSRKKWTVKLDTPAGLRTVISKHFVQATGVGSQKPLVPKIADNNVYKGINIHSSEFRNGKDLMEKGVKSVVIIGSANTAFDVLVDCHDAGLQCTMNVRSPTYICPTEYVIDHRSLGAYDHGVAAADQLFLSLPSPVDGALAKGLFAMMASQEPDRYKPLAEAGFPVLDALNPDCVLLSNLIESCGGHYMDIGGTKLIADKAVGLIANVEAMSFTPNGLKFSDNSTLDTDAVVWCTGFCDIDISKVAAEVLGDVDVKTEDGQLGPQDIASHLDSTWGIDSEGEIRGMWKRHPRLDGVTYWVMGGYTQQHRFHSRTLALQIQAELQGVLPPAYLETPAAL